MRKDIVEKIRIIAIDEYKQKVRNEINKQMKKSKMFEYNLMLKELMEKLGL